MMKEQDIPILPRPDLLKVTPGLGWKNKAPNYPVYKVLYERLVPTSGMAATTRGEALRAISRLYYDAYCNGGCNSSSDYYLQLAQFLVAFVRESDEPRMIEVEMPVDCEGTTEILIDVLNPIHSAVETVIETLKKAKDDEYESWDALDDPDYLLALERTVEWVTWRVQQLDLAETGKEVK